MKNKCEIFFGEQCVGCANLTKEGLYYRICCKCNIKEKSICRVVMVCANGIQSLGVLLPNASGFALTARIPVKKVDLDTLHFRVEAQDSGEDGVHVPISADMALQWLPQLEEARLCDRKGTKMLVIKQNET